MTLTITIDVDKIKVPMVKNRTVDFPMPPGWNIFSVCCDAHLGGVVAQILGSLAYDMSLRLDFEKWPDIPAPVRDWNGNIVGQISRAFRNDNQS